MNRVSSKGMGKRRSRQNPAPGVALSSSQIASEIPHTFGGPQARFSPRNSAALAVLGRPQLTTCLEILNAELETLAPARRSESLRDPCLFEWLRERFGKRLWAERSGDSQSSVPRPARMFTGAGVIDICRDGQMKPRG